MSLDAEEQDDELLALASIYEESFTSMQDQEADLTDTQDFGRGGELAISLDLPPDFSLLTRLTGENGMFCMFLKSGVIFCSFVIPAVIE